MLPVQRVERLDTPQILSSSATFLARAVRERRVTARELVDVHIARIEKVNPTINALVRDRFADARREADRADEVVASIHRDDLPALHGVPITSKEALACEGMPNSSGLWSRRDVIADRDASALRRLKDAGAIVLGVSNISELCMWMESSNKIYGRTNNPYDVGRTAGGSSGGEGALVGSGASPLGLGSDVGGSIRMPAFFNGVFGHKPTGGLVPNTGHYPPAKNLHQRYVTTGPLTRRAEDLLPVLRILAGPDGIEERCIELRFPDAPVDLRKLTAYVLRGNGVFEVERPMLAALDRAAHALSAAGVRVEERRIPSLKRAVEIWSAMLHEGGEDTFRELMANGAEDFLPIRELARMPFGKSNYTLPGVLLCMLERVPGFLTERTKKTAALGAELRKEIESILGDDGVLLKPSYPSVAPKHHRALLPPFKWIYTGIFNVLEMPVTQVPLGLDAGGIPLGVQVAGSNANDHVTIRVAEELERAIGGWVPPPKWPLR
jgi:fatty acid amide hydrolase 2